MDPSSTSRAGGCRALAAAAAGSAAATGLAHLAAGTASGAPAPDAVVAALALAAGALAAAVLALGCAMLALTALGAAAGRTWSRTEAMAVRLVPGILRRILTVGVGAGITLGLGSTALADEIDVGWQVTGSSGAPVATVAADAEAGDVELTLASTPVVSRHGDRVPERSQPAAQPAGPSTTSSPATVTVRTGDSLWAITEALLPAGSSDDAVAAAWPRLYEANRDAVGPDPGLIHPGDVLVVPSGLSA